MHTVVETKKEDVISETDLERIEKIAEKRAEYDLYTRVGKDCHVIGKVVEDTLAYYANAYSDPAGRYHGLGKRFFSAYRRKILELLPSFCEEYHLTYFSALPNWPASA